MCSAPSATPYSSATRPNRESPESAQLRTESDDAIAAVPVQRTDTNANQAAAAAPQPPPRILRTLYWSCWFVLVPFVLACPGLGAVAAERRRASRRARLDSRARARAAGAGRHRRVHGLRDGAVGGTAAAAARALRERRRSAPTSRRRCAARSSRRARSSTRPTRSSTATPARSCASSPRRSARSSSRISTALRAAMAATPFDEERFVEALVRADGEVDIRLGRGARARRASTSSRSSIAIFVALGLRAFVVEAFKIPSGSMIPTLQIGDHIFVNKFVYGPAIPCTDKRALDAHAARARRRDRLRVPREPRAGLHQARRSRSPATRSRPKNGHPSINGWEVPHCYVGSYSYTEADAPVAASTRAISSSSTSATRRTSRSTTTPRAASPTTRARST